MTEGKVGCSSLWRRGGGADGGAGGNGNFTNSYTLSRHLTASHRINFTGGFALHPPYGLESEQILEKGEDGVTPMGRWGHSATMVSETQMLVLGGQADDDAHQATLGDLHKFDFGEDPFVQ